MLLDWTFAPPAESDLAPRAERLEKPLTVVKGLPYHLSLGVVDGEVSASVLSPLRWEGQLTSGEGGLEVVVWNTLTAIGDNIYALTVDERAYIIRNDELEFLSELDSWVAETRVWTVEGENRQRIAVCLPDQDKIVHGIIINASAWDSSLRPDIGPQLGREVDGLFHPISLAGSSDGRLYVLDAGNARIAVFDKDGNYITEWGGHGSDPGTFNFGDETLRADRGLQLLGSIAGDDDGFIYVADVFNRRIQKFAP